MCVVHKIYNQWHKSSPFPTDPVHPANTDHTRFCFLIHEKIYTRKILCKKVLSNNCMKSFTRWIIFCLIYFFKLIIMSVESPILKIHPMILNDDKKSEILVSQKVAFKQLQEKSISRCIWSFMRLC